jgi:hypothetical protein
VQARALLEAGYPLETIAAVGKLRDRGVRHPDLAALETSAKAWTRAAELADSGEFLRALEEMDGLRPTLPCPATGFDRFRNAVEDRYNRFRAAVEHLYDAAEARQWRDALAASDAVLAVAPEHREAKALRGKAWMAASPDTADYVAAVAESGASAEREPTVASTRRDTGRPAPPPLPGGTPRSLLSSSSPSIPKRFLLWVDGVGGYLVCLSNRVTFGQATGEAPIDVPLFADVSRLHAEITRDGEGYVVESSKSVLVNGKDATRAVLSGGDRVTLGATCQFLFHKPVSVSSTARLELTSGHRLPVAVDGVLLMGNEVMLGAAPNAHIILPGLSAPILIYRSKEGLGVRVPDARFRIDDRPFVDRAALPLPAVVTGDAFTFAVEPVAARL